MEQRQFRDSLKTSTGLLASGGASLTNSAPEAPLTASDQEILSLANRCWSGVQNKSYPNHLIGGYDFGNKERGQDLVLTMRRQTSLDAQTKCSVDVETRVKTINEMCDGIDTLKFGLMGQRSFATGKIKNFDGLTLGSLFRSYKGQAVGIGIVGGAGSWSAKSNDGLQIKGRMTAIPVPFPGGDVALGYTACNLSYELSPASEKATVVVTIQTTQDGRLNFKHLKTEVPLNAVMNLAL
ncbi:MAG: hypothetical protein KF789_03965 [Bdellovibrionaceae bacterium]|nr:hypothetical protein [Pseudobdellovibrionaceae bacterium]